jgi:hypothetical protein
VNAFGYFAAFGLGLIIGAFVSALIFAAYYDRKEK